MVTNEHNVLGVLFLLISTSSGEFTNVFPEGQEVVYTYVGDVQAGTNDPVPYASQFKLKGSIRVQGLKDSAIVQLQNVKYTLYNGPNEKGQRHETNVVDIPESAASDLTKPFQLNYNSGKIVGLILDSEEPLWSENMKKAVAGILQLDLDKIKNSEYGAFVSQENTIHGTCNVLYSVHHIGDVTQISKVQSEDSCQQPIYVWKNIETSYCPDVHMPHHSVPASRHRVYNVTKHSSGSALLEHIEASGEMYAPPYSTSRHNNFITVRQSFEMQSVSEIVDELRVNSSNEIKDLELILHGDFDIPSDHYLSDKADTKIVSEICDNFNKAAEYLDENHVVAEEPDTMKSLAFLVYKMKKLQVVSLEEVYTQLEKGTTQTQITAKNLYLKVLPMVGSRASAVFVRNLIRKHKVKESTAVSMLITLPIYIRQPSEKLLQELEDFIYLPEDMMESVKRAGVLSFASLVYKTCSKNGCQHDTVDKYVLHYFQKLKENPKDYAKQQLYLQGLKNIRIGKVMEYLMPIVTGKLKIGGDNLRHSAIWAVMPSFVMHPEKAYRILWPILADSNMTLELRTSSLAVLIYSQNAKSRPSFFLNLHWLMSKEPCFHLYHYYYTILTSLASSHNPCISSTSEVARQILSFTRKPERESITEVDTIEYSEQKFDFADLLTLSTVADPKTGDMRAAFVMYNSHVNNFPVNYYSAYLKVVGTDYINDYIFSSSKSETPSPFPDIEALAAKVRQAQPPQEPLHLECIVMVQGQTVMTHYYNDTNIGNIKELIQSFGIGEAMKGNFHQVMNIFNGERNMMTDLGVPAVVGVSIPHVVAHKGNFHADRQSEIPTLKAYYEFRRWIRGSSYMKVYNPIAQIWHGVGRSFSYDSKFPLDFEMTVNTKRNKTMDNLRIVLNRPQGDGHIGLKWHTKTETFADNVTAFCPACKQVALVSRGNRKNQVVFKGETENYKFKSEVFDCEHEDNVHLVLQSIANYTTSMYTQYQSTSFIEGVLKLMNFNRNLVILPVSGSCGLNMIFAPKPDNVGSKAEITLKIKENDIAVVPLSGYKIAVHGVIKFFNANGVNTSSSYVMSADIVTTNNGIQTTMKGSVSKYTADGQHDGGVCVDFEKTYPPLGADSFVYGWGDETVHTKMSVSSCTENVSGAPPNAFSITVHSIGEITEEQKRAAESDEYPYGQCKEDAKKPEWQGPLRPRTSNCFAGAVKLFYARKITHSVSYRNVPDYLKHLIQNAEDIIKASNIYYLSYVTDERLSPGEAKVVIQFNTRKPTYSLSVASPSTHYKLTDAPLSSILLDIWQLQIDNTHFSKFLQFLQSYNLDYSCIVNKVSTLSADNATIVHPVGEKYELVSGLTRDCNEYSVFIKKGSNGLIVKLIVENFTLEMSGNSATLNGKPVQNLDKGVEVPSSEGSYLFRAWNNQGQTTVYIRSQGVYLIYSPVSLTLDQPFLLEGRVTGLCGNFNGDPVDDLNPTIYTL